MEGKTHIFRSLFEVAGQVKLKKVVFDPGKITIGLEDIEASVKLQQFSEPIVGLGHDIDDALVDLYANVIRALGSIES